MKEPEFEQGRGFFGITFFGGATKNVTDHVTDHVTDERLVKILQSIQTNDQISVAQLAKQLKVARRTILRDLEELKKRSVLKRIGKERGGHWQRNDARLKEPEFEQERGFFGLTFYGDTTEKVVEKVVENLSDNQRIILECIQKNPHTSNKEIAKVVGISIRKTQENVKKLKDLGLLKRIGPDKGGHWQIVKPKTENNEE